jgi:hypothetical protein
MATTVENPKGWNLVTNRGNGNQIQVWRRVAECNLVMLQNLTEIRATLWSPKITKGADLLSKRKGR